MSNEQAIATLKLLRDVIDSFSNLVQELGQASDRHDLQLGDVKSFFVNNPTALASIRDAISQDKLGMLMDLMIDFQSIQADMKNFMDSDSGQLEILGTKLKNMTKKFDEMLEGL